jgi:hypothetical protein
MQPLKGAVACLGFQLALIGLGQETQQFAGTIRSLSWGGRSPAGGHSEASQCSCSFEDTEGKEQAVGLCLGSR